MSGPSGNTQWIFGSHAVTETITGKAQSVRELWVEHRRQSPAIGELVRLARRAGARVNFVSRSEMDKISAGRPHQGLAAKISSGPAEDFMDFLKGLSDEDKKGMVLLALDQIQDPHNLGAIARSALNLGAGGIILPERRTSPLSAAAIQASAGAIQKIPVFRVVNLARALEACKKAGFWVYGADASGKSVWDVSLNAPVALVIGSEGHGMRDLVRGLCDDLIRVPQIAQGVESLNASCAATVLLYEICRQQAAKKDPKIPI